jgi:hypothetical protein
VGSNCTAAEEAEYAGETLLDFGVKFDENEFKGTLSFS